MLSLYLCNLDMSCPKDILDVIKTPSRRQGIVSYQPLSRGSKPVIRGLASLEAKRKFMAPKVVPKHIEGIDSSSPSSVIHVSDTPSSAEEAATIDHPQGILLDSENTKDERPSGDSLEDMFTYKSTKVKDISHNREKCVTVYPHSTLESNHAHTKLSLSSHKETNYNTASDISASNTKSENRKDTVRSKFFKHKLSDENHEENNPIVQKRDFDGALGESLMSRSASFGHGYRKNTMKKRKVSHVHVEDKEVPLISTVPEAGSDAGNSNKGGVDGKLSCEISHLKKYSGIAEKSMERFVSVISSFRYTSSGSRASGLRAPLKDVQNTAPSSTTGPVVDFSNYRYVPNTASTSTTGPGPGPGPGPVDFSNYRYVPNTASTSTIGPGPVDFSNYRYVPNKASTSTTGSGPVDFSNYRSGPVDFSNYRYVSNTASTSTTGPGPGPGPVDFSNYRHVPKQKKSL